MRDPVTVSELSKALGVDRTTVTANLKPVERRGLLTVTTDIIDARARRIALTEAGVAVLEAAIPIWSAVNKTIGNALTKVSPGTFLEALSEIGHLRD